MRMRSIADLIVSVAAWAEAEPDVRAVALVGSHARGTARADSDVDLIVLVDDVTARLRSREWLMSFGEATLVEHEDWGLVQSLRARYADRLEVEFGLAATCWARPPIDARTAAVICGGLVRVWDPDGVFPVAIQAAASHIVKETEP